MDVSEECRATGSLIKCIQYQSILYISGVGEMKNFTLKTLPWYFPEEIQNIEIENGVSTIGTFAFYGFHQLKGVIVPQSLKMIGSSAFSNCISLESIIWYYNTK